MLTRCDCCEGRKHVTGLGGMRKDCDNCKGVGFVKQDAEEIVEKVKRKYTKKSNIVWSEEKPEIEEIKE